MRRVFVTFSLLSLLAACTSTLPVASPTGQLAAPPPSAGPPTDARPSATSVTPATTPAAAFEVRMLEVAQPPGEIVPGTRIDVSVEVENVGAATGTYVDALTVNGIAFAEESVTLVPGEATAMRFTYYAGSPGEYTLGVGPRSRTIEVLGPAELVVQRLDADEQARRGEALTVAVRVANEGGLAGSTTLELVLDGKIVGSADVTLDGGARETVEFDVMIDEPGEHELAVGDASTTIEVLDISRPASGRILVNRIAGGRGRLAIENGDSRDALVVLAPVDRPNRSVLAVYVRAGDSATVRRIRDGTYVLFFSHGRDWDRSTRLFTRDPSYGRFDEDFPYVTRREGSSISYPGWKVSLQPVIGGNAATTPLSEGAFPAPEGEINE